MSSNFDANLLKYVQTVVELKNRYRNAPALASDPSYLVQLEQARSNISEMLSQLRSANTPDDQPHDGYHVIWQPENPVSLADQEDLYENTGPGSALAAKAAIISSAALKNSDEREGKKKL